MKRNLFKDKVLEKYPNAVCESDSDDYGRFPTKYSVTCINDNSLVVLSSGFNNEIAAWQSAYAKLPKDKPTHIWTDENRLFMIEKSSLYSDPTIYQYGFYDGYQKCLKDNGFIS